jgi:hypothetical protein
MGGLSRETQLLNALFRSSSDTAAPPVQRKLCRHPCCWKRGRAPRRYALPPVSARCAEARSRSSVYTERDVMRALRRILKQR